jgi:lysophospholipase L1-like esterase
MKLFKPLLIFILVLVTAPCLWAQITIMPLGDSITLGIGPSYPTADLNGYRQDLYLDLVSSGYDVNFVGQYSNGTFLEKQHEGASGATAADIASIVYSRLVAYPADIILLHIGTNDLSTNTSGVENILNEIDRWETARGRTVVVILARIINRSCSTDPSPCPESEITSQFNVNLGKMAQRRINDLGDRLRIVNMENIANFDYRLTSAGGDMSDDLHPDVSGYEKIAVNWLDSLQTILPLADAGVDQSVNEKTLVTLDGSGSFDPDGASLSYLWEQVPQVPPGTSVTLSDRTDENPTFTAPEVGLSGERLEFKLTVTDADGFQNSDTVLVDINDVLLPPVADAGGDQTVTPGSTVTLNGSNSYDPDGTITSVQWEQVSGATQVSLTNPTGLTTNFTAPMAAGEVLGFKLRLSDDNNFVSEDTATVTITTTPVDLPVSSGGGGGGGCFIMTAGE